jgi:ribosome-binding ATPase YchF (GTP1/OBG family)
LQVVRVFENGDITHVHGTINPKFDREVINSELILADIETLEKRIITNARKARADKEAFEAQEIYEGLMQHLGNGNLAITYEINDEQKQYLKDLHLLTNKKFVYAANVSEDMMDIHEDNLRTLL